MRSITAPGLKLALAVSLLLPLSAQPRRDTRLESLHDPDHFQLRVTVPENLEKWDARRDQIRRKLAIAAGLWPEPARSPLIPAVFDWKDGDGFRVARVYFESLPGFLVTGNLYVPRGKAGPFPAILTPHGHWKYGRLQNEEDGSVVARCIDFARMGFVALSIDMIGYNDSLQLPHDSQKSRAQLRSDAPVPYEPRLFRGEFDFPLAQFYGLSLGGLQLWNGTRSLDFLCSLPEVDCERIGVTGASGGALQTLLLMAYDDRVKVAAPVNIIGAAKHPGCHCENFPGLWLDTSTLELAATFAPRPLLLVSASEDPWTGKTPERELPFLRQYYALFGASSAVGNTHVQADHNYNADSRRGVYSWFLAHLEPSGPLVTDPPAVASEAASLGDLRVFPGQILPDRALSGQQIIENWIQASRDLASDGLPAESGDLEDFSRKMSENLRLALSVEKPDPDQLVVEMIAEEVRGDYHFREEWLGRKGRGDWFRVISVQSTAPPKGAVVVASPEDGRDLVDSEGRADPQFSVLLEKGFAVYRVKGFVSGELQISRRLYDSFHWSDAYNRDSTLEAIQDTLTALVLVRSRVPNLPVTLVGLGRIGIAGFFAAAVFQDLERVVIDLDGTDPGYDEELRRLIPIGSLGRLGGFASALLSLSASEMVLFNPGSGFDAGWYQEKADRLGFGGNVNWYPHPVRVEAALGR